MQRQKIPTFVVATWTLAGVSAVMLQAKDQHDWQQWGEAVGRAEYCAHTSEFEHKGPNKPVLENSIFYGKRELKDTVFAKNLTCYGAASLHSITVDGVTTMYGMLTATDSSFNEIDVRNSQDRPDGKASEFDRCTIKILRTNGALQIARSSIDMITTFHEDVTIAHSQVQTITVMNRSLNKSKPVTIDLINTTVEGSIKFSQKGAIVRCKNSVIKGEVIGGTVEQVS